VKDEKLVRMQALLQADADVRLMVRLVLDAEGATSLQHLKDISPEMFDLIVEEAESLVEQGNGAI